MFPVKQTMSPWKTLILLRGGGVHFLNLSNVTNEMVAFSKQGISSFMISNPEI
jgi:hypothetical protein